MSITLSPFGGLETGIEESVMSSLLHLQSQLTAASIRTYVLPFGWPMGVSLVSIRQCRPVHLVSGACAFGHLQLRDYY